MPSIIDLLVKIQILDERQHDAVMSRARSQSGGHLIQEVAELGYATEGSVARAVSVELGLPRIDLAMTPPEPAALALLDARTCGERFLLPVALRENGELLWVAMADPTDQDSIGVVRRKTQKRVRPAVAGASEILRAVRTLYSAPHAGEPAARSSNPPAIEIAPPTDTPFEVVSMATDIGSSPLSRIAKELGVELPAQMPSQMRSEPPAIDTRAPKAVSAIPPKSQPPIREPKPLTMEELFAPALRAGAATDGELSPHDLSTLDALRMSMEKGALVLRALAQLCVEKGVFTREEIKRRHDKA